MISILESADNIYCCYNASEDEVDSFLNEHKNIILSNTKLDGTNCNLLFQLSSLFTSSRLKIITVRDNENLSKSLFKGIRYFLSKKELVFTVSPLTLEILAAFDTNSYLKTPIVSLDPSHLFILVHVSNNVTYHLFKNDECDYLGDSPIGTKFISNLANFKNLNLDNILSNGDNTSVDLLVSDIYQKYSPALGLPPSCIASSLHKLQHSGDCSRDDLIKSLILALAFDVTSHALAYAQINHLKTIAYSGDLLNFESVCKLFHFAAMFRSANAYKSLFFKHSQYVGPLGLSLSEHGNN